MADNVVIVESPAKAKTIGRFLGSRYRVLPSLGHVRDLPKSRVGIDLEHDFAPKYVIPKEKRPIIKQLKEAAKNARSIYLATDPDREGEAISWHIMEAAGIDPKRVRRVVFHEITKEAIADAFKHWRAIDMQLVNAQQARRILDRLVGYELSPILWAKVRGGLSAGRVQSVAVRMIVERERLIEAFIPVEYWTLDVDLAKHVAPRKVGKTDQFRATFVGRFGEKEKLELPNDETASAVAAVLQRATYTIAEVRERKTTRQPAPPFTTSTLQQDSFRKLRFTAKRTMAVAQQLYEGLPIGKEGTVGLITYMRTDSVTVATSAQDEVRQFIKDRYGESYVPAQPRQFTKKQKNAQEAHEAIRPTSSVRTPESLKAHLSSEQFRLYDLIWKRFVASQMNAAEFDQTSVDVRAATDQTAYLLRATGSVLRFDGFLAVYAEGKDDDSDDDKDRRLPSLTAGESVDFLQLLKERHETQPPPRFTEATLVKALEERGIGRPSTYAETISKIQERDYVKRENRQLMPTELGNLVTDLLVEHFPRELNEDFTARMEEELDAIANGEREWVPSLGEFWGPFSISLATAKEKMPKVKVEDEQTDEVCDLCGRPMVIKMSRFGKFLACSGFPECSGKKSIQKKVGVTCPKCAQGDLVERRTRARGRVFYGCNRYPECDFTSWNRPMAMPCPNCGGMLTFAGKGLAKCVKCEETTPISNEPALEEQTV